MPTCASMVGLTILQSQQALVVDWLLVLVLYQQMQLLSDCNSPSCASKNKVNFNIACNIL